MTLRRCTCSVNGNTSLAIARIYNSSRLRSFLSLPTSRHVHDLLLSRITLGTRIVTSRSRRQIRIRYPSYPASLYGRQPRFASIFDMTTQSPYGDAFHMLANKFKQIDQQSNARASVTSSRSQSMFPLNGSLGSPRLMSYSFFQRSAYG